jgi:outer membrane protein OmpA-like peptidoglycan-associated protein
MHASKYTLFLAASLLALASATAANAEPRLPWVEMQSTSVMVGIGGQSGEGMLRLPNLGTNCAYPFTVDGVGAGIGVGVSRIRASGVVQNMTRLSDLSGNYDATQGEATLVAGAAATSMKNRANNVVIDLQSTTRGVALGFRAQGMSVRLDEPANDAPRVYVVEFGFDRDWLGEESRAQLAQAIAAWKCRFVNIEVVGHADTVGNEDTNLALAASRAQAVRDYLVGAGVVSTRITTRAAGSTELLVPTGQGVRDRSNRAVVLRITPI